MDFHSELSTVGSAAERAESIKFLEDHAPHLKPGAEKKYEGMSKWAVLAKQNFPVICDLEDFLAVNIDVH